MKICLIEPGLPKLRYQSLGILYIAAVLEKHGFVVSILNLSGRKIKEKEVYEKLIEIKPNIVGISVAFGTTIGRAIIISRAAKQLGATVVWGGGFATALPELVAEKEYVDVVVVGEGEYTMLELCKKLKQMKKTKGKKKLEKVNGIVFKNGNKIVRTKERKPIKNLDELPMPAWHLINALKYSCNESVMNYVYVSGSRGCYFRCSHCYNRFLQYDTVRFRSPRKVVDEIAYLRKKRGIRFFNFGDNDFTCNKKWLEEFCKETIKRKLDIGWTCLSKIRPINIKTLSLMKEAGCIFMFFGIESASPKILKLLNRPTNIEMVKSLIDDCNRLGIFTKASFIIGIPTDTVEDLKETIKFAKGIKPTEYTIFWYSPIPSTPLFEISKKHGFEEPKTLEKWGEIDFFTDHNLVKSKEYKKLAKRFEIETLIKSSINYRFVVLPRMVGLRTFAIFVRDFISIPRYFSKVFKSLS